MSKHQRNKKRRSRNRPRKIIHVNIRSSSRLTNHTKCNSFHHAQALTTATARDIV